MSKPKKKVAAQSVQNTQLQAVWNILNERDYAMHEVHVVESKNVVYLNRR
jgi:hypothetical protein